MTLPYERKGSINRTRQFLIDLCNPKETPRVPKDIRDRARGLLKHYPGEYYMDEVSKEAPRIFGDEPDFEISEYVKENQYDRKK